MKRQHINTDNYEEFFLLYVDNELTEGERRSVEAFILEHPELKNELQVIMDTKLDLDETSFEGKEILFRNEGKVNEQNIEALQILLIDDELDPATAEEVETYSSATPLAARNLDQLRKTKLDQEEIRFPDKATLYRTDKKPAALISIQWFRIAAAAAVLLIAGLLWLNRTDEADTIIPIAKTNDQQPERSISGTDQTKNNADPAVSPTIKEETLAVQENVLAAAQQETTSGTPGSHSVQQKMLNQEQRPVTNYAAVVGPDNTTSVDNNELDRIKGTETVNIDTKAPDLTDRKTINTMEANPSEALAMNVRTDYISEAIYENSTAQDEVNDEDQKQRKGLRGLVRKANRIYNKVTNPDPERSSLVKVASFEIGLPR
jgi:hypothetical protein